MGDVCKPVSNTEVLMTQLFSLRAFWNKNAIVGFGLWSWRTLLRCTISTMQGLRGKEQVLNNYEVETRVIAKRGSPVAGDSHGLGRGPRRWPLSYCLAALLILVLTPQLFFKAMDQIELQKENFLQTKSIFGDSLLPTPWHENHDNLLGPENRTWQRSWDILKCSYPGWSKSSPPVLSVQNVTQECPSYFHWIDKDLAPWKHTGIKPTNIEMAKEYASFKVVILKGKLYVDLYYSCAETRAVFTVWGMLLLLEKYEGKIPDVEIMFDCMDRPQIKKSAVGVNKSGSPAPLFRYCSNSKHYDIPWPDWSFWGWPETNLEPWDQEREKIVKGSKKKAWRFKEPRAYWRGNPAVGAPIRVELLQCNNANRAPNREPKIEIHDQNWKDELAHGKKNSKLEDQCDHMYKIYAEGFAWSVSFKYILACGSPTLAISPAYYDFFMRGLVPREHYIPVRPSQICASKLCAAIAKEVRFDEREVLQAIRIGEAGQGFVRNELSMPNVYDYMFHMLSDYSALQRFKPSIPPTATQVTQSFILCLAEPHQRLLLEQSRTHLPWSTAPCQMSKPPGDGFQDFHWEAESHTDEGWATQNCAPRKRSRSPKPNGVKHGQRNGTRNGPTKQRT